MSKQSLAIRGTQTMVPKSIYWNCTRAERTQIALELERVRAFRARAQFALERLERQYHQLIEVHLEMGYALTTPVVQRLTERFVAESAPYREIAHAPAPVRLLACGGCGKATPSCTCVDSEGKALLWH